VEWAVEWADKWYGQKLDSRQRARARAVASAQTDRPEAAGTLLSLLEQEDIPAWRATFLSLLGGYADDSRVLVSARKSLNAASSLERAAAARLFAGSRITSEVLMPLLKDSVRLVRLDAAWVLSLELPPDSPARKELDAHLALSLDQPSGRIRLGQDLANRGRLVEAEKEMALAAKWDPYSLGVLDTQAMVLAGLGRTAEAGNKFYRAAELAPTNATLPMRAALAFAEAGKLPEAENAFRLAVTRDARFDRAWYNLGLLYARENRLPEAIEALRQAGAVAPMIAEYPYALATVLLRAGAPAGAATAAERTLLIEPNHGGAREILRRVGGR
jgi:tetratricopeptide (TPR) repeat protein